MEDGERSTKYFYNLERKRHADQSITKITRDDNTSTTDTYEILSETRQFYKTLYTKDNIADETIANFLNIKTTTLTLDERERCEGKITLEETTSAVKAMEPNKSPGIDGLTSNFYKHFWELLGATLTELYNDAYTSGELSLTQRRGIITLIYKKNDRTELKNWRPISLLTTDYKILTKVLANRLSSVLPSLIHSDQTACVRGRTINDNVSLIRDIITHANNTNRPLALISVDQLKAFDRVNHKFLTQTLKKYGFGPHFIRWIETLYKNTTSTVKVNGWFTAFIDLQRGLRQGCPLSAPLYILTAEILATHIRSNGKIRGYCTPTDEQVKLTQYADDTTFLLTDEKSINETFALLNKYEQASGAKINRSKCKGLWSGSFKHRTDNIHGFDWFNDFIPEKILGFYFGNTDCTYRNIITRIAKIRNTCTAWQSRDLSFTGKTLVINSLLTSILWYYATSFSVPPWAIHEVEKIITNFFWSNKMHWINKQVLGLHKKQGGFNIHNLFTKVTALRINTLRRLLHSQHAHWKSFTAYFLQTHATNLGTHVLITNYKDTEINKKIPIYHRELLKAWTKFRGHVTRTDRTLTQLEQILDEPLFNNPTITDAQNNTLYFKIWNEAEITRVRDICYTVIPGTLPYAAIHEQITDTNELITLQDTVTKTDHILAALPEDWLTQIRRRTTRHTKHRTIPRFTLKPMTTKDQPIDFVNATTNNFYQRLRDKDTNFCADLENSWTRTLPNVQINKSFWLPRNHDLIPNKRKDYDWKIRHRILPTAQRLHNMKVHNTPNCHNCNATETIEHLLLDCTTLCPFWDYVTTLNNKIYQTTTNLDRQTKLFGCSTQGTTVQDNSKLRLTNLILNTARFAIHKSAVMNRLYNTDNKPLDIFTADIKAQLRFQYRYHKNKGDINNFKETWLINEALGTVTTADELQLFI